MLKLKHDRKLDQTALDAIISALSGYFLPKDNILPPSLHLCKRVLGVQLWHKKERHCCDNPNCVGHVYEYVDRSNWTEHSKEACPGCGESRFVEVRMGSSTRLKPRYWFIHLGVKDALQDFFEDAWFTEQRGNHRDASQAGTYWGGEEYNRMKKWLHDRDVDFDSKDHSPYDLLLDWLQPYNSCSYSTGILSIRYAHA